MTEEEAVEVPPTERAPRIVLTMIVKNESAVLARCVNAIRPLIDAWCIVDTGSTDGTQELARSLLADLPGGLFEIPWRDFAYNRTQALELARPFGEYSLMIDADEVCEFDPGFDAAALRRNLDRDFYDVRLYLGSVEYVRPAMTATRVPFMYRGALHEYLVAPSDATRGALAGFHYTPFPDGARSHNPNKYLDDARVLEEALARNDEPDLAARYTFYLAQSYRDAGETQKAVDVYERRAEMPGSWIEEVFVSWRWCGALRHALGHPLESVLDAYARAYDAMPQRSETLCLAATAAREAGRMPTAYIYAKTGLNIPRPVSGLFLEYEVYDWQLLYELSVSSYWVGSLNEGRWACSQLLANPRIPDFIRENVESNLRFYEGR
jgi:tetratricopeptide (TPR) repeat protein